MCSWVKTPRKRIKGDRNEEKITSMFAFLISIRCIRGHAHAETIKVVFDTAYTVWIYRIRNQTYKGIDVEILDKVAEINGWDLDKSFPGFDAVSMQFKLVKQIPSWPVWPKQQNVKKSSPCLILTTIQKLSSRLRKADKITKYSQLKGRQSVLKNGTAAQRFLDKNKDKYGYKIKTFDTGDLMYNSLSAGAVDAVMDDQPVIQYAIQKGQDLAINMDGEAVGGFAFGVKKGGNHEKLITEFNKALAQMKADGTLDEIIKKWTGESQSSSNSAVPNNYSCWQKKQL